METKLVLCVSSEDFGDWIFENYRVSIRDGAREIVIGDERIIGVCRPEHLIGYRCNSIEHTIRALGLENFDLMWVTGHKHCLYKRPFKFGR